MNVPNEIRWSKSSIFEIFRSENALKMDLFESIWISYPKLLNGSEVQVYLEVNRE